MTTLQRSELARWATAIAGLLAAWAVAGRLLPNGLPFGVVLLGLVLGSLTAVSAIGLVLVYRASRVVNFAHAEIGGLAVTVAVVMVTGWHLSYFIALPAGLLTAVATGWLIDATVVRRFFTAPRLIFTVATIGVAQILGAIEIVLPTLFAHLRPLSTFTTPFAFTFRVGPLVFGGDHIVALVAVPLVIGGLAWFLGRSDTGTAVRAAADSQERALLLGIPVRRLSRVTWMLAAGLSGIGAMLSAPILGPTVGVASGPIALLAPLTAAVIGRMTSLPVTFAAALGIGVFEQAVFWSYPRSSTVDVGLFVLVLAALLLQRRHYTRVDDSGLGGYVAVREVRPIPEIMRGLPEVRYAKLAGVLALAAVLVVLPLRLSGATLTLWAFIAIYGILAVSLVVLTGWAGQISLGQFGFAGVGAATTASLLVHAHADLFVALLASATVGAVTAALIGIPALRIPGPFLAVTTLAFGVPVATFLLNSAYFPILTPERIARPILLQRLDLDQRLVFYYLCLAGLAVAVWLAHNYRNSRAGRVLLAVRDNERGAAAFSIDGVRVKLTAFAFSGALAGFAGGLYAVGLRGMPFSGFDPVGSLVIFTMVVIGGVASLPGALLGALYVESTQYFLHGAAQLLATGGGLLLLLMVVPGGLGEVVYGFRDRALRAVAAFRRLSVPSLAERPDFEPEAVQSKAAGPAVRPPLRVAPQTTPLLTCQEVDASYGQIQVLFDVNLEVGEGEIVALLGTNGAGKSTVLRVVAGLMPAASGRVEFEGHDISGLDAVARVKAGVVTVPGGRGVFGSLTVAENLRMGGWLARHEPEFLEATEARIFELFPALRSRLYEKASLLSGGEQQMLTLAQALLCRPRLLLIDELSLGLAPTVVASLLDVVRELNRQGTTIVVVEQSVNVATALGQRAVFMEKGQVRFSGPTAELVDRPDLLRSVFLRSSRPAKVRSRAAATEPMAPAVRLEVAGLRRSFGGVRAVSDVDFSVYDGEVLGIIGSNGAGKTTVFDLCSGFLAPDAGHIVLDGIDITRTSSWERAELGMGRLFQDARLFPSLTVTETIATALEREVEVRDPLASMFHLGAVERSELAVAARVDELIETMGLVRYRDAFISELSTGTRRIVELACAMAHRPSVLLLDEPSSGIAQRESEALAEVLLNVRAATGTCMVVIEHDVPLVTSIANRMLCLHLGEVIASGSSDQVLKDPAVISSYLGEEAVTIARSGKAVS
ncbi:MAG TPA: ATP-binding cassette domain-containing protein [Candidatus Solibacter sp.]|jgi:ABC-type branched-subunit amino acid transport system ATPase component/ABC-type branched-subunit amino acid transport system permease subunit|nr:ATP-binding cassette domain-containing protein [Candidatus Solibacter sp.]